MAESLFAHTTKPINAKFCASYFSPTSIHFIHKNTPKYFFFRYDRYKTDEFIEIIIKFLIGLYQSKIDFFFPPKIVLLLPTFTS